MPQCLAAPAFCPPGAEPLAHVGGPEGALVLHGFTGSPWEMRPVGEALVAEGLTVAMPVLAGHATSVVALDETGWPDWLASAQEALQWLERHTGRVHLVGLSMGSLLALLLSARLPPERLASVTLLAPALVLPGWQQTAIEVLARVGWPPWLGKEDPRLPGGVRPPCYHAVPLRAARQLVELQSVVVGVVRPPTADVLMLHGSRDPTIPHDLARAAARRLLGPQATWRTVVGAGHLLPRDGQGPEVVRQVLEFVQARRSDREETA